MTTTPYEADQHDPCIDPGCGLPWQAHTAEHAQWCTAHATWVALTDPHTEAELRAEGAMGVPIQDRLAERRRELERVRDILFPKARDPQPEAER